MKIITKNEINSLDGWMFFAPPKGGKKQWKPEHSAQEFAKIVLDKDKFESEACDLVKEELGKIQLHKVYPEKQTKFDKFKGGKRHHDLACLAKKENSNEKIALCYEAKATETLDKEVQVHIANALQKNPNSNMKNRVNSLTKRFWGKNYDENLYGDLRYQLFSGLAGTICFAEKNSCSACVFVIYQIETDKTKEEDMNSTRNDVVKFIQKFNGHTELTESSFKDDHLYDLGALEGLHSKIQTYIAYIRRAKKTK